MNGSQFGTVITMPISGVLASSSLGWPSIFYAIGVAGIIWSILFYCTGADEPSKHPRICPKEASYINGSLGNSEKTADSKVSIIHSKISSGSIVD